MADSHPLLEVTDLEKHYPVTAGPLGRQVGTVRAVDGVSLTIRTGETLGLVGESGCGKSTLAASMLRLEEPTGGSVRFDGEDVLAFDRAELKRFRRDAQLLLQEPGASFDPRMRVGESVVEPLRVHGVADRGRRRAVGRSAIERVGLSADDYDRYPHEFSGGQRQRLALARALVVNPRLLVADEPVSALDVSVQAEILSLLADLQERFGLTVLFVSHDLSVVREVADRVAVMYLGEIVEVGPTAAVFEDPEHPYTEALLAAIPRPDPGDRDRRVSLSGPVPDAADPPTGCRFHTRCPAVIQPPSVDLDQATWRRVLDARDRIVTGDVDLAAIRERAGDATDERPPRVGPDRDRLASAARDELGLPAAIDDRLVDDAVADAVDALIEGDPMAAAERLVGSIETPCEKRAPDRRPVGPGREAACHLHGPFGDGTGGAAPKVEFEWVGERGG